MLKFFKIREARKLKISFEEKFQKFQEILSDNEEAHKSMSELAEIIVLGNPFSRGYTHQRLNILLKNTEKMIQNLNDMTEDKYLLLMHIYSDIANRCYKELVPRIGCPDNLICPDKECRYCDKIYNLFNNTLFYYNLKDVREENCLEVGNKMARLGEIKNILNINVPDGFCLSISFFEEILQNENIRQKKNEIFYNIDFNDIKQIEEASRQAQALIVSTAIPKKIEDLILEYFDNTFKNDNTIIAVRSSAIGEDSEKHSFAGLHQSELNITRENVVDAIIEVLISKYSPQSVTYRFISGLRDEDMPMSVGCIEMVDAKAGGVLYTQDPQKNIEGIIIQSVWGLGSLVVEGKVKPQEFIVTSKDNEYNIEFKSGYQNVIRKAFHPSRSDSEQKTDYSMRSLSEKEIITLVEYAKKIEMHYNQPQDIEWAVDKDGKVYILQSRALKMNTNLQIFNKKEIDIDELDSKFKPLIKTGDCASHGIGTGKVFKVYSISDIGKIPVGAVVVTKKNLPEFTAVLHKISALISDIGSTTGHLSIIARELNVPMLTNVLNATEILQNGMEVTVIADENRVYEGIIKNLTTEDIIQINLNNPFLQSPLYLIWHDLTRKLFKLNLYDASSEKFKPENCETLHDIIRFIHEQSMRTMFSLYENSKDNQSKTYQLDFEIPLDLIIINLGGGLKNNIKSTTISTEDIVSEPMKYLIKGMLTPGIMWSGHLSLNTKGFARIIMGNIVDPDRSESTLGSRSYAIISEKYINFYSRLGYHFSRIDAMVSEELNRNYLNFNFRGGAANQICKSRRAKAIGEIFEANNFYVNVKEDNVYASIKKIPKEKVLDLLTEIGKLLGAIRNTDVTMLSDEHVDIFVKGFLEGDPAPALRYINK